MTDHTGAGGTYIRQPDGTEKLVSRTQAEKPRSATAHEDVTAEVARPPAPRTAVKKDA